MVVEFLNSDGLPNPGDGTEREYYVSYGSLRLAEAGPPNQLFYPKDTRSRAPNRRGRGRQAAIAASAARAFQD